MNSEELKQKRTALGLTQSDLAAAIGKSRKTINTYEQGAPIPASVEKLLIMHFERVTKGYKEPQKKPPTELEARFEDIVARRVIEIITPILEKLGENQKSALGSVDDFKVTMQHLLLDLDELKDEIEEVKDLVKQSDSKLDKLV
jgi:transcriptional regulator with XRE-family HTH domain